MRSLLKSNQDGFTLLETIIAIAIMVMAFAAILSIQSSSINSSLRARQMNVVGMLARNLMIETEYKFEGKTFDEVKKEETGTFEAPYQDYRWKKVIKEVEFPSLSMNVGGASGDSSSAGGSSGGGSSDVNQGETTDQITKLVTQYLSKAIREVTVTVTWSKGGKDQNFSVSTYWVDLNHEFQLSL